MWIAYVTGSRQEMEDIIWEVAWDKKVPRSAAERMFDRLFDRGAVTRVGEKWYLWPHAFPGLLEWAELLQECETEARGGDA